MGCRTSKMDGVSSPDHLLYQNFIREITTVQYQEHYLTGKLIGEGSFGEVYRCKNKKTDQIRVLKKISKKGLSQIEKQNKFVTDIKILQNLDHQNILQCFEYYQDEFFFYVITEYLDGGSLLDRILQKKYLSEVESVNVIKQILDVLSYCQNQKIVHRDIKLENIVLQAQTDKSQKVYKIKVIDWGCSQQYNVEETMNQLQGTPLYLAPEVIAKKYNYKCDLWSLGVLAYIMICGEPPFQGSNISLIIESIKKMKYQFDNPLWDSVSDNCKDFIQKLLVKEGQRMDVQEALNHKWIQEKLVKDNDLVDQATIKESKFTKRTHIEYILHGFLIKQVIIEQDRVRYEQIFKKYDKNNDGVLDKQEIQQYIQDNYVDETLKMFVEIMADIDKNNNGVINLTEFLTFILKRETVENQKNLKNAFDLLDIQGSGFITREELSIVIGTSQNQSKLGVQEVENFMSENDTNKDGKLSFEEFQILITKCFDI